MGHLKNLKNPMAGAGQGRGCPKGYATRKTLDKLAAREEARQRITAESCPIQTIQKLGIEMQPDHRNRKRRV